MQTYNSELCARCKGRGYCGRKCPILTNIKQFLPKSKLHFSGSSPPEIFVGRYGYPNINTGVLSPQQYGSNEIFSSPEEWFKKKATIEEILSYRGKLIYGKFKTKIKDAKNPTTNTSKRFISVLQEVSMAKKSTSTEFFLKKPMHFNIHLNKHIPIIGNPAPIKNIRLEENPKIEKKVDYVVGDDELKSKQGIKELYKSKINTSNIIKILSAGLLGLRINRKFVPTRWAITAVDDTLSKEFLKKIKFYPEINNILLFKSDYIGNHYEFLLLPDKFSFEVIEAKMPKSVWNPAGSQSYVMQDYESFNGRKKYAENVTGAYYTNRLAVCEYLEKIKHQASCLVLRECRPEYWAPLGVGILREASREAFKQKPEKCQSIKEALKQIQTRLKLPIKVFKENSQLLKEYKKQTRLTKFF